MAEAGYGCVFGDCPTQFTHMITDMSNGATVTLCDDHYPPGLIPLLAAALGVDPGRFYTSVERFLAREAKQADKDLANAQAAQQAKSSQALESSPDGTQADYDPDDENGWEERGPLPVTGDDAA